MRLAAGVAISCSGRCKTMSFGPAIVSFQRQIYKIKKQNASFFLFFSSESSVHSFKVQSIQYPTKRGRQSVAPSFQDASGILKVVLIVLVVPAVGIAGAGRAVTSIDFLFKAYVVAVSADSCTCCADDALVLHAHHTHRGFDVCLFFHNSLFDYNFTSIPDIQTALCRLLV